MQHKLGFKRNARFDYMAPTPKQGAGDSHLTRPKFGIGETPVGVPKSKAYSTAKPGVCFVCEPEEVVISRYEAGYVYEMEVQVCDRSFMSRARLEMHSLMLSVTKGVSAGCQPRGSASMMPEAARSMCATNCYCHTGASRHPGMALCAKQTGGLLAMTTSAMVPCS